MTKLNAHARNTIREYGFTVAEWIRMHGYEGRWTGDQCGCFDDRCANGYHHTGTDDCQCLPTLLDETARWRRATRSLHSVELVPRSYGLNDYVSVIAPGVLVSVSTSNGGLPPGTPAGSVVRIEVREGWTAETTTDEHGRMVVRLVQAQKAEEGQQ
jgi:hypothetical protein